MRRRYKGPWENQNFRIIYMRLLVACAAALLTVLCCVMGGAWIGARFDSAPKGGGKHKRQKGSNHHIKREDASTAPIKASATLSATTPRPRHATANRRTIGENTGRDGSISIGESGGGGGGSGSSSSNFLNTAAADHHEEATESEVVDVRASPPWWRTSQAATHDVAPLLVQQSLRSISYTTTHAAALRPVPHERAPHATAEYLAWEYEETAAFVQRQLKADPRLRPAMVEVTTDHLNQCLSCENERLYRRSLGQTAGTSADGPISADEMHASSASAASAPASAASSSPPSKGGSGAGRQKGHTTHLAPRLAPVGTLRHPLVDDFLVESHRNLVRFLHPPSAREVALTPTIPPDEMDEHSGRPRSVRFGCPCAVFGAGGGSGSDREGLGVRIWHTDAVDLNVSGGVRHGRQRPPLLDEHYIVSRQSADGVQRWSAPSRVNVDGVSVLKTFVPSAFDAQRGVYYAGYVRPSKLAAPPHPCPPIVSCHAPGESTQVLHAMWMCMRPFERSHLVSRRRRKGATTRWPAWPNRTTASASRRSAPPRIALTGSVAPTASAITPPSLAAPPTHTCCRCCPQARHSRWWSVRRGVQEALEPRDFPRTSPWTSPRSQASRGRRSGCSFARTLAHQAGGGRCAVCR